MRLNYTKTLLMVIVMLLTVPAIANAQRTKPRLRRPAPRYTPIVAVGTNLKVRLNESLSSKDSRAGDRFTATVIDPVRLSEATVNGHVRSILRSGKIQGRTTMNLAFDSINLTDGRHGIMHGYVTRVYGENAGRADEEGGVQSSSRSKQTLKRGAIGAGAGAILGGIIGGGKGAGIGLLIGGAGGVGSLVVQGSKELKLESGTELLVHVTR